MRLKTRVDVLQLTKPIPNENKKQIQKLFL